MAANGDWGWGVTMDPVPMSIDDSAKGLSARLDGMIRRAGAFTERKTGVPAFASLAGAIALAALIPGMLAMYQDIATHLDNGRDATLFTPGHIFALMSLGFALLAACIAIYLYPQDAGTGLTLSSKSRLIPRGLRGRKLPYGGVFAALCLAFVYIGFPFDFMWHEVFGEDVTLWGPTHLELLGGGTFNTLGFAMLIFEARRMPGYQPNRWGKGLLVGAVVVSPIVFSSWLAEFDFGAPQFQALYLPVLIAMATGGGFVFARLLLGRGGAMIALGAWIGMRTLNAIFTGAVLGFTVPTFTPYVAEAISIELIFLLLGARKPFRAAVISGVAVGTAGVAQTIGFTHIWAHNELPWDLLPSAMALGTLMAVSAAVLATGAARALAPDLISGERIRPLVLAIAGIGVLAAIAIPMPRNGDKTYIADMKIDKVDNGQLAYVTMHFDDPSVVDGAEWFKGFAWQGGGSVLADMVPQGGGDFRTSKPLPITGEWKAMIRIADGSSMRAAPVYFGPDTFIKKPPLAAVDRSNFEFGQESYYMMREYEGGSRELEAAGYGLVALLWIAFLSIGILLLMRMYREQMPSETRRRHVWPQASAPVPI